MKESRIVLGVLVISFACVCFSSRMAFCQSGTVFLGDSMMYGFENFSQFLPTQVVNLAVTTSKTSSVVQTVSTAAKYNPKSIFIMSGINDVSDGSLVTVVDNYESILGTAQATSPKATVYVQALFPVNWTAFPAKYSISNQDIGIFNSAIYNVVKTKSNAVWLDFAPSFKDSSGNLRKELSSDGLHLNQAGYEIWGSLLAPYF